MLKRWRYAIALLVAVIAWFLNVNATTKEVAPLKVRVENVEKFNERQKEVNENIRRDLSDIKGMLGRLLRR